MSEGICGIYGGVWGYMSDFHGNQRPLDVFGGIWVLIPCIMEPKYYSGTSLKCRTFVHMTLLRQLDFKMAAY